MKAQEWELQPCFLTAVLFIYPEVINLHLLSSEKWREGSIFSSTSFTLLQLYSHVASSLPSSPFLKFSPSASPNNILSFLPFLSPDQFSSLYPVPLFSPPPRSHPFSTLQLPHISFFPPSSSLLRSSLACLGTVAEGGGRKAQLAALATCIIHAPCSRRGFSAGSSLGHMGLVSQLCLHRACQALHGWDC